MQDHQYFIFSYMHLLSFLSSPRFLVVTYQPVAESIGLLTARAKPTPLCFFSPSLMLVLLADVKIGNLKDVVGWQGIVTVGEFTSLSACKYFVARLSLDVFFAPASKM